MDVIAGDDFCGLVVVSENDGGEVFFVDEKEKSSGAISLNSFWESHKVNFNGQLQRKVIRKFDLYAINPSASEIKLTITNDENKSVQVITTKERFSTNLFFEGKDFTFKLESADKDVEILMMELEVKGG